MPSAASVSPIESPAPESLNSGDYADQLRRYIQLPAPVAELAERYRSAKPFPHLVIDGLFPDSVLEQVLSEAPELSKGDWVYIEADNLQQVLRMRTGVNMGPASYQFASFLHSPAYLYLMSEITGVWQLLPDPYLQGGGHAAMKKGMFFEIHTDRNTAYETGLTRRLAMITFLNRNWKSEYAGQLELWNHEGTRCEVSIEPLFNRTVLFEVATPNFHGVPTPLNCPEERARHSFIVYFHTVEKSGLPPAPHTSLFSPLAYQRPTPMGMKAIIKSLTPPLVWRSIRRFVKKQPG